MRTKFRRAAVALLLPSLAAVSLLVGGGCTTSNTGPRSFNSAEYFTNSSIQRGLFEFPKPVGPVVIDIETGNQDLPQSKGDGELPVKVAVNVDGVSAKTYGTFKVQGSSTAGWPKKNWSLKLYADEAREEALPIKIGDSVPSNQWVAKAEWLDPTQMRNLISYRLWADMVESRTGAPQLEIDNSDARPIDGAKGYPATELAQVLVDGQHYGVATLTLGHDPQNFNIDPGNPQHVYMEFDARGGEDPEHTWDSFSAATLGSHITSYLSDDNEFTGEQAAAVGAFGAFINGPLDDFQRQFDDYFDKTNMVDMLLFMEMIHDWDAVSQDIEMVTYDLQKWYFLPWDKDTTFGLFWDGSGLIENSENQTTIDTAREKPNQKPWFKTYHAFQPDVEARYAQLRDGGVFTAENVRGHVDDLHARIPPETWEAERNRWEPEGRPSLGETDTKQIVEWFTARLETLDQHFDYQPPMGQ